MVLLHPPLVSEDAHCLLLVFLQPYCAFQGLSKQLLTGGTVSVNCLESCSESFGTSYEVFLYRWCIE